jgi:alpha-1,6-mannosyltransferase
MLVAVALLVAVAAMKPSPISPTLPKGAGSGKALGSLAGMLGLQGWTGTHRADLSIVVMFVFAGAFLFGLREAWHGRLSSRKVLWFGIALVVVATVVPLLESRDVYSYALYGRIAGIYHRNPYVAIPRDFPNDSLYPFVGPVWRDTPAVYGPAFTMLSGLLARTTSSTVGLIWAFKLIGGAAAIGTLALVAWIARRVAPGRAAFAVALFGWNPAIIAYAVGGGHNDLLVALCIAGALALLIKGGVFERIRAPGATAPTGWPRYELVAVGLLTLGTLVKASAGPALVLAVVAGAAARPRGSRLRLVAIEAAVVVGLAVVFGAPFWQTKNPTLGVADLATHRGWVTAVRLLLATLGGIAENLWGGAGRSAVEAVIRISVTLAAVAALVLIAIAVVRRTRGRAGASWSAPAEGAAWAWGMLVFILAAPVLLPWYVAWTLPVAWLLPRAGRNLVVALSCLLVVTHSIANPVLSSRQYGFVLLVGHDVVGPIMLVALVWAVLAAVRLARGRLPLEDPTLGGGVLGRPATAAAERQRVAAGTDGD